MLLKEYNRLSLKFHLQHIMMENKRPEEGNILKDTRLKKEQNYSNFWSNNCIEYESNR